MAGSTLISENIKSQSSEMSAFTQEVKASSAEDAERMRQRDILFGVAFAKIVSLIMHSKSHSHLHVSDLKWLVVPPLVTEQFAIVDGIREGSILPSPFAAAFWAYVSQEVDQRLSNDKDGSVRLMADEWQSGELLWIIDAVGDPRIVPAFLEELAATKFPGRYPKMRVFDEQGVAKMLFVGLDDLQEKTKNECK